MIGIEADVAMAASEASFVDPLINHSFLCLTVTIFSRNFCIDAIIETDDRPGADNVIESKALRDRIRIEPVRCGRENEASSLQFVPSDRFQRTGPDVGCDLCVGKAVDEGLQLGWMNLSAEQQMVIDLLKLSPVDQSQRVGDHRKQHDRQEQQTPWRTPARAMK